jgi:hypothetical protein
VSAALLVPTARSLVLRPDVFRFDILFFCSVLRSASSQFSFSYHFFFRLLVQAATGFWLAREHETSFIRCVNDACQAGQCDEGYQGNLCTECNRVAGFGRDSQYDCVKCPDQTLNRLRLGLTATLAVVAIVVITYFTIKSVRPVQTSFRFLLSYLFLTESSLFALLLQAHKNSRFTILFKILLSNIQFNSLAVSFDFQWPEVCPCGFVSCLLCDFLILLVVFLPSYTLSLSLAFVPFRPFATLW